MSEKLLEIACFNLGSAIISEDAGAGRVELCANYWEGGITPLERTIIETRERIKIPVHVIIRARGGDFNFSEAELNDMKKAIRFCRQHKLDGVVIGVLTDEMEVDTEACEELLDEVGDMSVTFHRAIDHCLNIEKAMEDLISLGIKRVLCSAGETNASVGAARLKRLHNIYGKDISVMPGGGVRSSNLAELLSTGCREFHSSALIDNSLTANSAEIMEMRKMLL